MGLGVVGWLDLKIGVVAPINEWEKIWWPMKFWGVPLKKIRHAQSRCHLDVGKRWKTRAGSDQTVAISCFSVFYLAKQHDFYMANFRYLPNDPIFSCLVYFTIDSTRLISKQGWPSIHIGDNEQSHIKPLVRISEQPSNMGLLHMED